MITCSKQIHNQGNKYIKHHLIKTHKTQSNKHNKTNQTHVQAIYNSNFYNNSKIQENNAIHIKYLVRIRKPIPFSWRLELKWWKNGGFSRVTWWVWERYKWGKQWIVTKVRGKNWKFLKTLPKVQNMRFSWLYQVTYKSQRQVFFETRSSTHEEVAKGAAKTSE